MAKLRTVYRCTECGAEAPKWAGRCESCSAWNTLAEEIVTPVITSRRTTARSAAGTVARTVALGAVTAADTPRWRTGLDEFDFVLGGGIVPGSMVLVGGEPGIGKSTLLLQVASRLEAAGHATLYVSGEESALQVRLRAERLAEDASTVSLLTETSLETILATAALPIGEGRPVRALIVDSIQTVHTELLEGAPGNVGQVRECAARLMRFAKDTGTTVFVIGHVTKGVASRAPRRSSTLSIPCSISRVMARSITGCCGPPRTASAASTRSASSVWSRAASFPWTIPQRFFSAIVARSPAAVPCVP